MVKRKATSPLRSGRPKQRKASPHRVSQALKRKHSSTAEQPAKRVRFASSEDELSRDEPEHRPRQTPKKPAAVKATSRAIKKPRPPTRVQPQRGVKKTQLDKRVDSPAGTPRVAGKRKRVASPQTSTTDATKRTTEVPKVKRPCGRPRKEPKPQEVETQGEPKEPSEKDNYRVNGSKQKQAAEVVLLTESAVEESDSEVPTTTPRREVTVEKTSAKEPNSQERNKPAGANLGNEPISSVTQQDPTPLSSSAQNASLPAPGNPNSPPEQQTAGTTAPILAAEDMRICGEEGVPPADDLCLALALRHLELGISTWREVDLTEETKLSEGILHARSGAGYEWERRYEMRLGVE